MLTQETIDQYIKGNCEEVWKTISFFQYDKAKDEEKTIIEEIVKLTLDRVAINFKMVLEVLKKNDFEFKNYGNLNIKNQQYLLKPQNDYQKSIKSFYQDSNNPHKVPLLFSSFLSYFEVVDFRGEFLTFENPILLDALFIESFSDQEQIEDMIFELDYWDEPVKAMMFSPDAYVKEDASGDLGACIKVDFDLYVDNFVINYFDDFRFTFIDYLRFCFNWACFPNLNFASMEDQKDYLIILEEVRSRLIPF